MVMRIPSYEMTHRSENVAFNDRVKIINEIIEESKSNPELILRTKGIISGLDPPREQYDFTISEAIHTYLKRNVPFRKDVFGVETIQYPLQTLQYGGDCDCMTVLAGSQLQAVGIETKLAVSKQDSNFFDHIFLYLPSIDHIFDLTIPIPYNLVTKEHYPGIKIL